MNSQSIKWLEIANLISDNPLVKVKCPNCDNHFLSIFIIPWEGIEPKVDIHLVCEGCNAKNVITKNVKIH